MCEIQRQRNIILNLDSQILLSCRNVDAEIKSASDFNLTVTNGIHHAKEWLAHRQKQINNLDPVHHVRFQEINLKKMKKFSGNPLKWPMFWNLFKTNIDDRRDIGEPAKFFYLISQLEGEAQVRYDTMCEDLKKWLYSASSLLLITLIIVLFLFKFYS